jgi:hypothetical protein
MALALAAGALLAAEPGATTAPSEVTAPAATPTTPSPAPVAAPAPAAVPGSLALLPKETVAFIHIPRLSGLEADLKQFTKETGLEIGRGEHPVLDMMAMRTGLSAGLDPEGSATIGFLDPKKYHDRYTLYILPVADWDALLKGTVYEEMSAGLYALTGAAGPRYVARRGKYAIVTSSVRTMDAAAASEPLAPGLPAETLKRAAGFGPMLYVNVHQLTTTYSNDIATWFRAASGQVYNTPEAVAYADMLTAYMLGIADFLDQIETAEASLRFGAEGLSVDLQFRFVEGAGVAKFLSAQVPGTAVLPLPAGQPLASAVTLRLESKTRTDAILGATRFFLEKSPRPDPLPETTKDQVFEAVQTFADSLGPDITFLSTPAAPGMGVAADVTVLDVKDEAEFRRGLTLMVAAWEALANQLNLYMKFELSPEKSEIEGVPVTEYMPRFRFGLPARHMEFRERLKAMYGPEGLVYRVAVVGGKAVVSSGSDLSLMRQTIARLKKGEAAEVPAAIKRLAEHLAAQQQISIALSLPLFVRQSLLRGGTSPERIGTIDPGKEIAGLTLTANGPEVRVSSYWPHEQIRLAMDLLKRAAPEIVEAPKSLFEPAKEGPPKAGAAAPDAAKPGEKPPAEKAPAAKQAEAAPGAATVPPAGGPAPVSSGTVTPAR